MKKARASRTGPSARSLREMPELDFAEYRVSKNRFARRMAREGAVVLHQPPTRTSLKELPEPDFERAAIRRNPYAQRIAAGGIELQVGRGRPRRDAEVGPTVTRSVRLPPKVWAALEKRARAEGVAVHALIRRALLQLIDDVA